MGEPALKFMFGAMAPLGPPGNAYISETYYLVLVHLTCNHWLIEYNIFDQSTVVDFPFAIC